MVAVAHNNVNNKHVPVVAIKQRAHNFIPIVVVDWHGLRCSPGCWTTRSIQIEVNQLVLQRVQYGEGFDETELWVVKGILCLIPVLVLLRVRIGSSVFAANIIRYVGQESVQRGFAVMIGADSDLHLINWRGIVVVAEWIETEDLLTFAHSLGFDLTQGWYVDELYGRLADRPDKT